MTAGLAPLLSTAEVAALLGIPERTLEFWRYQGRGPTYTRVGKRVRYHPDDVAAYLQAQRRGASLT